MAHKLILPPDQASYSVVNGEESIRQQLDGGLGRYRADIIGASRTVTCQWSVGPDNYRYLQAFYNTLNRLSEAFKIDLYLDQPVLTEHDAHFIPGSWRLSSQSGLTWIVSCQLEVEPIEQDEDYDTAYIDIYEAFGSLEGAAVAFKLLEKLVNIDLDIEPGTVIPPDPEPEYPDNALTSNGYYLTNGSGAFLYGPLYVPPPPSAMTDESGNRLLDENSNVLLGEFA